MSFSHFYETLTDQFRGYGDVTSLLAHYYAYHHKMQGKLLILRRVDYFDIHMFFKSKYWKGLYEESLFNEFKIHFYRIYVPEDDDY